MKKSQRIRRVLGIRSAITLGKLFDPSRLTRKVVVLLLLATLVLTAISTDATAQSARIFDDLSVDTIVYVRIANVSQLSERLQQLSIARAMRDPEVAPLVEQLFGGGIAPLLRDFEDEAGVTLPEVLSAIDGELVFCMIAVPAFKPAPVLMFRPEPGAETPLETLLDIGRQRAAQEGVDREEESIEDVTVDRYTVDGQEFYQLQLGEWRMVTTQREVALQLIQLRQGIDLVRLGDHPPFRTIRSRCSPPRANRDASSLEDERLREDAEIEWYVDPIGLARAAFRGNFSAQVGLAILPAIGADGIQAVGGSVSMAEDQYDLVVRSHLLLESPRSGVTKVVALGQGPTRPEAFVSADVGSYATWHIRPDETFDTVEELYDSFREEGSFRRLVDQRVSENLGVNLRDELLTSTTGRFSVFTQFERPISIMSQATLVGVQLKDPIAFQTTLAQFTNKWSERLKESNLGAVTIYAWDRERSEDADDNIDMATDSDRIESDRDGPDRDESDRDESDRARRRRRRERRRRMRQSRQPAFAIVGESLLIADRVSALEQAIMAQDGIGDRLRDELDFKLVSGKLTRQSSTPMAMLRFERPDEGLEVFYELLRSGDIREEIEMRRDSNEFLRILADLLAEDKLPPFEVLAKYLAPTGSMLANEETGFHYTAFALRRE